MDKETSLLLFVLQIKEKTIRTAALMCCSTAEAATANDEHDNNNDNNDKVHNYNSRKQ